MKKLIALLLALLVLSCSFIGVTETLLCDCNSNPCTCFLQEGDEGLAVRNLIALLKEKNLLDAKHADTVFDESVTLTVKDYQIRNGLEGTGMLDDETLTLLIWGTKAGYGDDETAEILNWVPSNGGKKRHDVETCCGMIHPRKMSARNAKALEIDACGVCKPK